MTSSFANGLQSGLDYLMEFTCMERLPTLADPESFDATRVTCVTSGIFSGTYYCDRFLIVCSSRNFSGNGFLDQIMNLVHA